MSRHGAERAVAPSRARPSTRPRRTASGSFSSRKRFGGSRLCAARPPPSSSPTPPRAPTRPPPPSAATAAAPAPLRAQASSTSDCHPDRAHAPLPHGASRAACRYTQKLAVQPLGPPRPPCAAHMLRQVYLESGPGCPWHRCKLVEYGDAKTAREVATALVCNLPRRLGAAPSPAARRCSISERRRVSPTTLCSPWRTRTAAACGLWCRGSASAQAPPVPRRRPTRPVAGGARGGCTATAGDAGAARDPRGPRGQTADAGAAREPRGAHGHGRVRPSPPASAGGARRLMAPAGPPLSTFSRRRSTTSWRRRTPGSRTACACSSGRCWSGTTC